MPFPVGGIADTFGRTIGAKLTEAWGQPVVIENKTGAGGNIGAEIVAKSAPDGYTLVMGNIGSHAVNASLFKNIPFDPIKDFARLHTGWSRRLVGRQSIGPCEFGARDSRNGACATRQTQLASGGLGTTSHLAGELFSRRQV